MLMLILNKTSSISLPTRTVSPETWHRQSLCRRSWSSVSYGGAGQCLVKGFFFFCSLSFSFALILSNYPPLLGSLYSSIDANTILCAFSHFALCFSFIYFSWAYGCFLWARLNTSLFFLKELYGGTQFWWVKRTESWIIAQVSYMPHEGIKSDVVSWRLKF